MRRRSFITGSLGAGLGARLAARLGSRLAGAGATAGGAVAAAGGARAAADAASGRLLAWITVSAEGRSARFEAHAQTAGATEVRYALKVLRIARGGRSTSSQSGRQRLEPETAATLSSVAVNLGPGDAYAVELLVTAETGEEALATLSNPPATPQ